MVEDKVHNPVVQLLKTEGVTEIMVNSYDEIFYEQDGRMKLSSLKFASLEEFKDFVFKLLKKDGHNIKERLFFDGALSGVYRYNVVLPPMNPNGPLLTVRRFLSKDFDIKRLIEKRSISNSAAEFLSKIVKAKMNIIISGGTGSGKTTFLQALAHEIPRNERIVTIEDSTELKLPHKNWVQLLSVDKLDQSSVSIKDCLINSLRMRPNRILVGECRNDETFEMLQAMNTGHEGSMTTIHANNTSHCLSRLENLLHSNGHDVDLKYLRSQISQTIDYIVQLEVSPQGERYVAEIVELSPSVNDMITRALIFKREHFHQELETTGVVPSKREKIAKASSPFSSLFFKAHTKTDDAA